MVIQCHTQGPSGALCLQSKQYFECTDYVGDQWRIHKVCEDKWHNTTETRHKNLSYKTWGSMREVEGKTTRNDQRDFGNARGDQHKK